MKQKTLDCKVCGEGELKRKKKYRMSGPVVVIGYFLIVPSVIGLMIGALMMFTMGEVTSETKMTLQKAAREELVSAGISQEVSEKVINDEPLTEADTASLTTEQSRVLDSTKLSISAGKVGAGAGTALGGGLSIFLIMSSLVGVLLGFLLVMKKRVLQCVSCKAVVAAS